MRQLRVRISFCLVLLIVAVTAVGQQAATSSDAVVPPLINFSGTLTDINGKPLTSIVGVTFSLYNDQQAASPLWMETQNVTPAKNGRYSVQLGSTSSTGLPADIFVAGEARWLGVQPQGQAEYPRVMLLSVPYALKAGDAQTIGGLPPSAFLLAPSAAGTTSSTRTASSTPLTSGPVTGSGTVNFLPLWDGTSDIISSALFQSGSAPTAMIGINTATPTATLDVATGDVLLEAGNLDLPQTSSATNGVITLGGAPFMHACCSSSAFNTFVGTNAGNFTTTGAFNTGTGYGALMNNTAGGNNTAAGYKALNANLTGSGNTAGGYWALTLNQSGWYNTAFGESALVSNVTSFYDTAVGQGALNQTTGGSNTGLGAAAGLTNTSGTQNTFLGANADAGSANLTNATAIGSNAIVGENNALVLGAPGVRVGIGTATPAYSLDVQGSGNFTGMVTFAPGQTFPGTGTGTITGVTPATGGGLTGGGTTGSVSLGLTNACASGQVLQWNGGAWACSTVANGTITGVTSGTGLTGGGSTGNVTLNVDPTQVPFLNSANVFTGNQTVNGNLSATGLVTGSGFQIGSNLFDFGSYANQNALLGFAGNSTMTGNRNTASGSQALYSNTTGYANTASGATSLYANTTGAGNTGAGGQALGNNTTGAGNTGTGYSALYKSTTGTGNTGTGFDALPFNTTGAYNTGVGFQAGAVVDTSDMSGQLNTFLGAETAAGSGTFNNATAVGAYAEVGASNSLVLGSIAGVNNCTASNSCASANVGIGTITPAYTLDVHGTANFTGLVNFAPNQTFPGNGTVSSVGSGAGLTGGPITTTGTLSIASAGVTNAMLANPSLTVSPGTGLTGGGSVSLGSTTTLSLDTTQVPLLNNPNTFTGNQTVNGNLSATGVVTGSSFQIGSNLFAFGSLANNNAFLGFAGNATVTGNWNTATGSYALVNNTTGFENTANGSEALYANTTGIANTAVGTGALGGNTSGLANTATGSNALLFSTTGNYDTATGDDALIDNTTGGYNTATGNNALSFNSTGNYNTASGFNAGITADRGNMSGSLNTFLGYQAVVSTGTLSNATAIGANAEVDESNAMVLGSINGVNQSFVSTNVGIGTTTPQYTLDVHGNANFTGLVNFAANQTFPGNGTVSSVGSGAGLTGGPITTTGTLSIAPAGVTNAMLANPSVTVSPGPGLTGGGAVALGGATTLSLDTTQVPLLNNANTFTGNQTVNGNLSATGMVTGSAFNIGSNLFGFGSYANQNAFLGFAGNTSQTGTSNTATGVGALASDTTGYSNTALGSGALVLNTTGADNAALGSFALEDNTTGYTNTAVGDSAMNSNTTGGDNTAIGSQALQLNTTGNFNTGSGFGAGYVADSSNMTGSSNTFLGAFTRMGTGSLTNATAIGTFAEVDSSNSVVLGSIAGVNSCTAQNGCASTNVGIGTTTPAYTLDVEAPSGATPTVNFGSTSNPAALTVHGTGNFTGLVTFAPNQTFPGTGTGTITGVTPTKGGGLVGGGTSGSVALGLTNSCASGQVLQWGGAAWVCSTISGGGTITGVNAGTDLLGGGSSGVVGLALDTTKVPQLATPNSFAGTQTIAGNLALTGSGNGVQFPDGTLQTTAATGGSGVPSGFMILGSTSTAPSGYTLSGMTTSGNVAVSLAPMITPRYEMGVTAANGKIYAVGGLTSGLLASGANEVFDPTSNTWTSLAAVKTQSGATELFEAAAFTVNNEPCLMGGNGAKGHGAAVVTNSVECFNASSNAWNPSGTLVTATYDMAAVVVPACKCIEFSGDVLSVGGRSSPTAFLNTIEYSSSGAAWLAAATTLPTARAQLAAVIDPTANKLYAIGGFNSTSPALSTVEVLDLTTGLWSTAAPLSAPRRGLSAVYLNGKIYAIGGFNGSSIVSTVEVYDPTSKTWTTVPFPGRQLFGAVVLNNLIYLVGGQDGANVLGSTEQYSPPVILYNFTKN